MLTWFSYLFDQLLCYQQVFVGHLFFDRVFYSPVYLEDLSAFLLLLSFSSLPPLFSSFLPPLSFFLLLFSFSLPPLSSSSPLPSSSLPLSFSSPLPLSSSLPSFPRHHLVV